MNKIARSLTIILLAAACAWGSNAPRPAAAVVPVFDPSNFAKNALTAAQTYQIARQTYEQLQAMLQNMKPLQTPLWTDTAQQLQQIVSLLNQEHVLSITDGNLDQEYNTIFPSYVPPQQFGSQYATWYANTKDSVLQALQAAGVSVQQIGDAVVRLRVAERAMNTATGRQAVEQAVGNIAAQQAESLQKIQALDSVRTQAEMSYYIQESAASNQHHVNDSAFQSWLQQAGDQQSQAQAAARETH